MRVFFSAGEASGDVYAAELCLRIGLGEGVGGKRLAAAGGSLVADSSAWGALGVLEALRVVPRVWSGFRRAKRALSTCEPGVFVPIDFGYMNIRLARHAKACGWRVVYFIPPGSWRRDRQGADLPQITDAIVTPFPWSADLLKEKGANAHFWGHPLLSMIPPSLNLPREGVAVLPGSRSHEIQNNTPAIVEALDALEVPRATVVLAPTADPTAIQRLWRGKVQLEFSSDRYATLQSSQAAVICSGTATLEAALCGCPCVVVYRGSKWMEFEYKLRKPKFDFISMPNILLGRAVLPELIQWDASPDRIATELGSLMQETEARHLQLEAFEALHAQLQPAECLDRTADLIREFATSTKSRNLSAIETTL